MSSKGLRKHQTQEKVERGAYERERCKCKKHFLVCTDLFKCLKCVNGTEVDTDELQDNYKMY